MCRKTLSLHVTLFVFLLTFAPCTYARTITVDDGRLADYTTIQTAIDAAVDGDTVIVQPGTYAGLGNRDIDFKGKAITVRSTDPNNPNIVAATTIDCQGTQAEPHRGFVFQSGEDTNSVLAGLRIQNGYARNGGGIYCYKSSPTLRLCTITKCGGDIVSGGGIYCGSSNAIISQCTIKDNNVRAVDDQGGIGGGIVCFDSSPLISDCIISGNSQTDCGSVFLSGGRPFLSRCVISSNSTVGGWGEGGGIYCSGAGQTISGCIIQNNSTKGSSHSQGGGIYGCGGTIVNCTITDNTSYWPGGGGLYGCNCTISNCIIARNQAEHGGGLSDCSGRISNCVVTDNISTSTFLTGGGLYRYNGTVIGCTIVNNRGIGLDNCRGDITNCTVWGNSKQQIKVGPTEPNVSYCCFQGGWTGLGNISSDPHFIDPARGDFHLSMDSPCINAGDPNYKRVLEETDIDGQLRIMGGRVDIGADEFYISTPSFEISSANFSFTAYEGEPNRVSQILGIRNAELSILNWQVSKDCPWLEVDPPVGQSAGEVDQVTISINASNLVAGTYDCGLLLTAPDATNSPQTVMVTVFVVSYMPDVLNVPADYETIQKAVNVAKDGDSIIIAPGTYTGLGNHDIDFKGKDITVCGVDPNGPKIVAATIIDCQQQGRGFYLNGCTAATIAGLTITDGLADAGAGIYIGNSSATISNCSVIGNTTKAGENETLGKPATNGGDGAGIYCSNASVEISDCNISQNNCGVGGGNLIDRGIAGRGGNGAGICAEGSTITIRDCTISGNKAGTGGNPGYEGLGGAGGKGGGICCLASSRVTVEGCTVGDNSAGDGGGGFDVGGDVGPGGGAYCDESSSLTFSRTIVTSNKTGMAGLSFVSGRPGGDGGGICCLSQSILKIIGCTITNNVTNLGGYGCTGQCRSPSGNGGGIYCRLAVIEGSTISNNIAGQVRNYPWTSGGSGGNGGGIYCSYSLTLTGCTISGNKAGDGGSVHGDGYRGGNGGGLYSLDAVIRNCHILGNSTGDGGYSSWEYGAGAGSGSGVYAESLVVTNSLIVGNVTGNGGGGFKGGGPGGHGAGIWCGTGTISNCTIGSNFTGQGVPRGKGGGVFAKSGVSIRDSIVRANSPEQLFGYDCNNVRFSNIEGSVCSGGVGNISLDPLFLKPGYWADANDPNIIVEPNDPNALWVRGDYRLSQVAAGQAVNSPCVDAGSDTAANLGLDKFTTRTDNIPDSGIVDMGYHCPTPLAADLNDDGKVDFNDYTLFAEQWQQTNESVLIPMDADLDSNGLVDFRDLSILADNWLSADQ